MRPPPLAPGHTKRICTPGQLSTPRIQYRPIAGVILFIIKKQLFSFYFCELHQNCAVNLINVFSVSNSLDYACASADLTVPISTTSVLYNVHSYADYDAYRRRA